jgi:phosphoglycerol transferase MdoB-like AlkP superfamily enzyme
VRDELLAASRFTWWIAALASLPAVASGLVMTRGRLLGHDLLRLHHLFVWPAFALLIASAAWRLFVGRAAPPRALGWYRATVFLVAGLTAAAGAFGGEMALAR